MVENRSEKGEESGTMSMAETSSINTIASAKESGSSHPSSSVELSCVLVEKKALVHGEVEDIAEVTSHDFWQKIGKKEGLKYLKGSMGNITVRQRVGWSEAEQR